MAGRRTPKLRGGRGGPPKTEVGRMLQDYFQPALHTVDFNALASGGDIRVLLVDNSSDFSNAILKWSKLTIRPIWDADNMDAGAHQAKTLIMMVLKQDQDDGAVHGIDDEETVRELRNRKRIIRGPWWYTGPSLQTSGFIPAMAGHMKAIVLKDFVLDREEDLILTFTNVSTAFASQAEQLDIALKGFVRVIR